MFTQSDGYGSPILESYSVNSESLSTLRAASAADTPPLQITLHGGNFIERAMMLIVKIGDIWIQNCTIVDENTIVCYLDQLPEEGATISVSYGGNQRAELPERFSLNKLSEDFPSQNQ
jgi:IPT/TIG domain